MRTREVRDVIDVLILPGLDRALDELTKKNGSRRRARLLIGQSVDQLRKMTARDEEPEKAPAEPILGGSDGSSAL